MGEFQSRPVLAREFRLLVALLVLLAFLSALQPVRAADFWHHLKAGEWAWQHGPATREPFSHTALDREWLQFEWLSQICLYLCYRHFGATFLVLLKATLATIAFLFLWRACWCRGAGPASAAVAVMAAACAFVPRSYVRPEMFSLPLLGACLFILESAHQGRHSGLWLLFPIFALWPNLHGLYVGALALVGVEAAAATWSWLVGCLLGRATGGLPRPTARNMTVWWATFLGCAAVTFCNPYGWRVWEIPLRLAGTDIFRRVIVEWQPSDLSMLADPCYWPIAGLTLAALVIHAVQSWRLCRVANLPGRLDVAGILRLVVFGALALQAKRHISLFAFVFAPVCAAQTEHLLAHGRGVVRSLRVRFCIAGAILLTMTWAALGWPAFRKLGLGVRDSAYPARVAAFLRREAIAGNLFHPYRYGNYFLWKLHPQNRVFIDGRIDMYGPAILADYAEIQERGPLWRELLERYRVDISIVEREPAGGPNRLANALMADTDWRLLYWDDQVLLFLLNAPEYQDIFERLGSYTVLPDRFRGDFHATGEIWEQAVAEFRRKLTRDPLCFTAHDALAACYAGRGMYAQAMPHYAAVLGADPFSGAAYYNLGATLVRLGQLGRAETLLQAGLRYGAPRAQTLRTLGNLHYSGGDYTRAIHYYRQAARAVPTDWQTYYNMALAYEASGDRNNACRALEEVLRLNPAQPEARARLQNLRVEGVAP